MSELIEIGRSEKKGQTMRVAIEPWSNLIQYDVRLTIVNWPDVDEEELPDMDDVCFRSQFIPDLIDLLKQSQCMAEKLKKEDSRYY